MPIDAKPSPAIDETISEVQGIFPSDSALQSGIAKLTLGGFDRARISLPEASPTPANATPSRGAEEPMTGADMRQARTLGTSMAAAVGAIAGAGATIATGGAAGLAIAAAAGAGALTGGSVLAATGATTDALAEGHDAAAAAGKLVLAVHVTSDVDIGRAEAAMREAGASHVAAVRRVGSTLV